MSSFSPKTFHTSVSSGQRHWNQIQTSKLLNGGFFNYDLKFCIYMLYKNYLFYFHLLWRNKTNVCNSGRLDRISILKSSHLGHTWGVIFYHIFKDLWLWALTAATKGFFLYTVSWNLIIIFILLVNFSSSNVWIWFIFILSS